MTSSVTFLETFCSLLLLSVFAAGNETLLYGYMLYGYHTLSNGGANILVFKYIYFEVDWE